MPEKKQPSSLSPELQEELAEKLLKASSENRISCAGAFAIAKSLGIPASEVGKAANRLKIKISKCQLGCF